MDARKSMALEALRVLSVICKSQNFCDNTCPLYIDGCCVVKSPIESWEFTVVREVSRDDTDN